MQEEEEIYSGCLLSSNNRRAGLRVGGGSARAPVEDVVLGREVQSGSRDTRSLQVPQEECCGDEVDRRRVRYHPQ